MLGVAIMSKFACDECGCVSVILPTELTDSASVLCSGCGRDYGGWAQFKLEAKQIISAEAQGIGGHESNGVERTPLDFIGREYRH